MEIKMKKALVETNLLENLFRRDSDIIISLILGLSRGNNNMTPKNLIRVNFTQKLFVSTILKKICEDMKKGFRKNNKLLIKCFYE